MSACDWDHNHTHDHGEGVRHHHPHSHPQDNLANHNHFHTQSDWAAAQDVAYADRVQADRGALRSALVQAGVQTTEDMLDRVWEGLGGEPAYIPGRVYQDAHGVHWYRLIQPNPGPGDWWRNCWSGGTCAENVPARPLTLLGPIPSREQVEQAVARVSTYGESYEVFMGAQAKAVDRLMALLNGETG